MNNTNTSDQDLLSQAEAALKGATIPEGPSEEVMSQTLTAILENTHADLPTASVKPVHPQGTLWRRITEITTLIAAVLLLAIGFTSFSTKESLAFQDLAKPFREAKTLVYDTVMIPVEGPAKLEVTSKSYFKEPGLSRRELGSGGWTIQDAKQGVMLSVFPNTQSAILTTSHESNIRDASRETMTPINWLKSATANGESVEARKIDGVLAHGFRSQFGPVEMTIWGHPETKKPLLIEMPMKSGETSYLIQMSNFQFDLPLDDQLFSVEPPQGYRIKQHKNPEIDMSLVSKLKPEEHVVRFLKYYSSLFDGAFPEQIDDPGLGSAITTQLSKDGKLSEEDRNGLLQMSSSMGPLWMYRQSLKGFGYTGDARFGDKDRMVFWYRPQGAKNYRAVFGDLRIEDVTPEEIPTIEK